jgi:hypothetical protein
MTLELDRNGVPVYAGTAESFDEWRERALDLFHSRAGQDSLQGSTALALRGGLRDIAYEAARKIPHNELMTLTDDKKPTQKGVDALIEYVRAALQQETPIRVAETFELVFYDRTVWRLGNESMAAYIVRRKREFDRLKELSAQTEVSDDIKAHLLLKFSGLSSQQRSQVVASCANQFNLKLIESALRTQFPNIHESSNSTTPKGFGKKGKHGSGKPSYHNQFKRKPYGVWSAEAEDGYDGDYYEASYDEDA